MPTHSFMYLILILCAINTFGQSNETYQLTYSSYLGGSEFEQARDLALDKEGNIYVVGGTSSPDFPTSQGAYNMIYNNSGSSTVGGWGPMMVFVSKFSKRGDLIWSTYIGGPNYDRAYAVEVDDAGYVYVGGRAGDDFPTTAGAFQEDFIQKTPINRLYGHQNGFICKLQPDGSDLVWSTYYGSDSFGFFRDIDIDDQGNIYGILNAVRNLPRGISPTAFNTTLQGSFDMVPVKFSSDGTQVLWAGVLGGSGEDRGGPSIRVAPDQTVYVAGSTQSSDFPVTAGAAQPTHGGQNDVFLTRISDDGSELLFSTYLGGSDDEFSETHILALDSSGRAHIACATNSDDVITTAGVLQPVLGGPGAFDILLAKYDHDGQLLACSYLGGTNSDFPEGISINQQGDFLVGGGTVSDDFPISSNAFQKQMNGADEGFVVQVSGTLDTLRYASYFGGSSDDAVRAFGVQNDGTLAISGQTLSQDLPTTNNALQTNHNNPRTHDSYLSIFQNDQVSSVGAILSSQDFKVHPNPFEDDLHISSTEKIASITITDAHRRVILVEDAADSEQLTLRLSQLQSGFYLLSIQRANGIVSVPVVKAE